MKSDTMYDFWGHRETDRTQEEHVILNDDVASFFSDTVTDKDEDESSYEVMATDNIEETELRQKRGEHRKSSNSKIVLEYENWIGRVIDLAETVIGARITNTLNLYSPRYVRIERSFFASRGISQIEFGDEFELSFQSVRVGKNPIRHEKEVRMIQHLHYTRDEIDDYVDEIMRNLNTSDR